MRKPKKYIELGQVVDDENESDWSSHEQVENDTCDTDENNLSPVDTESSTHGSSPLLASQRLFWRKRLELWMFPTDVPEKLQLWRMENIALPVSYLLVGSFQGLSSGVMTVFLLQLGASEAQQTTIRQLRALPATFKILFGFISDTTPIMGYKRKGYMVFGWILSSMAMLGLFLVERHYSFSNGERNGNNISIVNTTTTVADTGSAGGSRNISHVAFLYFMFGLGFWFADVIADSIMTEKAKAEPDHVRGQLQSMCYACRFFMLMVTIAFAT